MEEKVYNWSVLTEHSINCLDKVGLVSGYSYYVEIDSRRIFETDFKVAKRLGFRIEDVEAIVDTNGKFRGLALWCTEEKGL